MPPPVSPRLLLPTWRMEFGSSLAYTLNQFDFPVVVADGDAVLLGSNNVESTVFTTNLAVRVGLPFDGRACTSYEADIIRETLLTDANQGGKLKEVELDRVQHRVVGSEVPLGQRVDQTLAVGQPDVCLFEDLLAPGRPCFAELLFQGKPHLVLVPGEGMSGGGVWWWGRTGSRDEE